MPTLENLSGREFLAWRRYEVERSHESGHCSKRFPDRSDCGDSDHETSGAYINYGGNYQNVSVAWQCSWMGWPK
jgi:hypothetical protein